MADEKSTTSETTQDSEKKSPEDQLAAVRSLDAPLEINANQQPVQITGYRGDVIPVPKVWATPTNPVDGGDGSHTTASSKLTDYVWAPFVPPKSWPSIYDFNTDGTIWFDTPATKTQNTLNDTAVIAANALTKF